MQQQQAIDQVFFKIDQNYIPHPKSYTDLQSFIVKQCKGVTQNFLKFIHFLDESISQIINFTAFRKFIRIIKKYVIHAKNQQLQYAFSAFLMHQSSLYFPYHIKSNHVTNFKHYIELVKGLKVRQPQTLGDQRQVILYLQCANYDEVFFNKLLQKINEEVIVDKKSQSFKSLKLNEFFSSFLARHIQKIIPQLERLLVRSQSNIQIWQDILSNIVSVKGMEKILYTILLKIKNYFVTYPQPCLGIIVSLGRALTTFESLKQFVSFLGGVISNEHNSKKKLNFLKMTEGVIDTLKKLSQDQKNQNQANQIANEILSIFSLSYGRFAQDDELIAVSELLDKILPLVKNPSEEIAKNLKNLIKNPNKNILVLLALTLSIYNKDHIETLPSVKQIFDHFKGQINVLQKKAITIWQWFVPIVSFLAKNDPSLFDNLSEDLPIFKVSCISMLTTEKKNLLEMYGRYYKYTIDEQQDIPNHFFTTLAVLLQDVKRKQEWTNIIENLTIQHRLQLLAKGIYPLLWYPCKQLKKNKNNNQFSSLVRFILSTLKKQHLNGYKVKDIYKILIVSRFAHVQWSSIFEFKKSQEIQKQFQQITNNFWKASMFDYENQEELLVLDHHREIIHVGAKQLLRVNVPQDFHHNLKQCLKPVNYEKNLDYIIGFEEEIKKLLLSNLKHLDETKQMLFERNFSTQQKPKQKKVYFNPLFIETRMMSQEQVKAQKYRKHFQKMLDYFKKYVQLCIVNLSNSQFLFSLWNLNFSSIIRITKYSETRVPIFGLVRKSIEKTYSNLYYAKSNNYKPEEQKIFLKYSTFFGQFFCIRHSTITPSISLMEKCTGFLKSILTIDFNSPFADSIFDLKKQFLPLFINDMCQEILENMEFDLVIKKLAIHFYWKAQKRLLLFQNDDLLFSYFLKNINILSSSQHIKSVIMWIMKNVDVSRYNQLFEDILSFVSDTKILILSVVNELITKHQIQYQPGFEQYIKLRILALQTTRIEISQLANEIIKKQSSQNKDILKFNMKNFLKKNSKQTVEKLCLFIKQEMKPEQVQSIFKMICKTFNELYDQNLDQQGLETFPFFLSLNIQQIKSSLFSDIFQLLVMKFTANQNYVTLSRLSMEVGIQLIKYYSAKDIKHAEQILKVLEGFINRSTGVSNIVFLGVLAPFLQGNKNLLIIQKRITELFKGQKEVQQRSIAKCMPDLMSFFKEPTKLIQKIYLDINGLPQTNQFGQAYLAVGLLKGIGHRQTMEYLQRVVSTQYIAKTKSQKSARIYLLTAFVEIFGRFIEIKGNRIVEIIIGYMADSIQQVRNISKRVVQTLILKMSAYAVKKLLPLLLNGLQTQSNWRVKISYIWILGIMANCSARQLQTSLPIIVPTLSTCLSNAHPNIRNKASEALNLIGQTIKNPEISNSIDILIEALQNPFEKSDKALDILLKTRFSHFIDAPSLSIIIPITDYCLRGRNSEFKAGACQVIGSIVELIINPYDFLPYLRIIGAGLKVALCDPLSEIRGIAAMAVGKISSKIGKQNAEQYFQFILDIIESPTSNTTERQGAAQAYSEIICSQDYDYFEESLNRIFDKLNEVKHSQKEGFILVFLYVPNIKRQQFEGFIKQVNQNMYAFVADEDQNIRNSALLVEKVLINHYCLTHTDLLLEPLCEGVFETNWRKRNGALILLGELLNILKNHMYNTRTQQKASAYYKGLMAVYILKDDDLEMPRLTANQVWNAYIENTPKTIRTGLKQLVSMWSKYTHEANGVVFKNIGQFSSKYGQNYFYEILMYMQEFMPNPLLQKGIFEVLTEFIKRLQQQFMMKDQYKNKVRQFFVDNIFKTQGDVRTAISKCLAIWVQKMREQRFFEQLVYPQIQKMDLMGEQNQLYTNCLHLMRDLLHTSSQKIVDRLINKIMEAPLSEFKIEVITNNADRLANQLYTQFKQPATEIFVDQIYTLVENPQKLNRLELIIYCLEQVSLKLNIKYKIEFIRMMTLHLRKIIQNGNFSPKQHKILKKFLGIIFFFLNSIQIGELEQLETLLGQITPLIFVKELQIHESVHKIFEILISNPKQQKTPLYLKQMIVSMENNANNRNVTIIWDEKQTVTNYIGILVKCIAYGNSQTMEQALEMTKFLMRFTKRQIIDKQILKIIGPIIRSVNYPLTMKQKILLMDFISSVYQKRFNIEVYSNQILSICFRLLQQFKTKDEIMQCISTQFQNLLLHSANKNELMLTIINKIKIYGNVLVEAVYYLVKSLINEKVELPKITYEKTYEEFNHICIHNQMKLPLRGLYYASKTAARLGVHLGVHIQKLSSQLKAITCPYEVVLNYLHFSYYSKVKVPKLECIQIFIKESSRQKVYYLLKSLKLCRKINADTKSLYNQKYIKDLVPEGLSGFDDIIDILQEFEDE